ncbi:hypothetical protein [Brevundimonas sp. Root1279]|uniref:hypothetical protein n=1 Tax=Brevundimonas sp. Root1279 TaxID=1736443 RepID=UPI0006FBB72F|nr:hypothetical protein [Brevundimonas sp. Root1279]KQW79797.1 hypothetical protein ASC65_14725 [Brevundimonas sp. Root1279]
MRYVLACASSLLILITAAPVSAQTVIPVQFDRGASSSTLDGEIRGQTYSDYRLVVGAGQRLSVSLRPTAGSPYFNVMEPGSTGEAIYNSSMGDQQYTGTTAHNGAYTIRVYQMRASGRRDEAARFKLALSVTDPGVAGQLPASGGDAASQLPGDALVPGTPYHATASIPCRSAAGAPMGSCQAGVIRRRGSATVHLDTPDGGERTILFRDGVAVSSDGDSRIGVERREDVSIVRIGDVEIYEIPDALIFGG